ncbi:MAG TPA: LuxR C-terminal-related transcriptional regulator [Planctomycetota bacterium]|nr:LuxR C-terminal-related transcriptional regulator [Planctomycetota bacterium]
MQFTSDEVERLLHVARDATLGSTFLGRMEAVCEALTSLVPNTALSAIVLDLGRTETPPDEIYYKNGVAEHLVAYTSNYIQHDPMWPAIPLADGKSHLLSDFVPDDKFGIDAFTSDFLKLLNVRHVMGLSLRMPNGRLLSLAVHRDRRLMDFTAKEREILRLAAPFIVRGAFDALLKEKLAKFGVDRPTVAGGVVLAPDGEIVHADPTGLALVEALERDRATRGPSLRERAIRFSAEMHADSTVSSDTTRLGDGRWIRITLSPFQSGRGPTLVALLEVLLPGSDALMTCMMDRARLSRRERDVARLAATGLGNREIAVRLGVSVPTVSVYLSRAYAKIGVSGRNELAALVLRWSSRNAAETSPSRRTK